MTTTKSTKRKVPGSALNILCVNRQINREAYAHFYSQNDLAFATPVSLQTFLFSLGHARLDRLRNLTFFYYNVRQVYQPRDELAPLDLMMSTLRSMRGLRKLHIILQGPSRDRLTAREIKYLPAHPPRIPGAKALFSLRNLTDFKIHNPFPAKDYRANGPEVVRALKRVGAAFKHFNYGLRLAQQGQIYYELYTNTNWDNEEVWPALGTKMSVCGSEKGCSCGPDSDDDE